ncbi:MAG: hypothetical protein D6679_05335 [Candidatus Hydrogenedentota bacterium]|nr:MAG: hypothetical protein D6679_05335 [Candidatus Hydrogenedentota bacterium]
MRRFSFGNIEISLHFPPDVRTDSLPLFIQSFSAPYLPSHEISIAFRQISPCSERLPPVPKHFGLHGFYEREGDRWTVHCRLPIGPQRPDALPVLVVTPTLFFVLAHYGIASLHAAAVLLSPPTRSISLPEALVFVGPSGCGKTTASKAMLSRGAAFLADDRLLLHQSGKTLLLCPSFERPNPFRLWNRRDPLHDPPPEEPPEPSYGLFAVPRVLLFPAVSPGEPSRQEILSPGATMARLQISSRGLSDLPETPLPPRVLTLGKKADRLFDTLAEEFGLETRNYRAP